MLLLELIAIVLYEDYAIIMKECRYEQNDNDDEQ